MAGIGLQRKSVADVARELGLQRGQAQAQFAKLARRLVALFEARAERQALRAEDEAAAEPAVGSKRRDTADGGSAQAQLDDEFDEHVVRTEHERGFAELEARGDAPPAMLSLSGAKRAKLDDETRGRSTTPQRHNNKNNNKNKNNRKRSKSRDRK